ncbi:MAG: hypothetical protein AABY22_02950, partial [Nanoarchaeota archaeon]
LKLIEMKISESHLLSKVLSTTHKYDKFIKLFPSEKTQSLTSKIGLKTEKGQTDEEFIKNIKFKRLSLPAVQRSTEIIVTL